MRDTKQDVLDMLRDLAELTRSTRADPNSFRVRAYESAARRDLRARAAISERSP